MLSKISIGLLFLLITFFSGCGVNQPTPEMEKKMYTKVNMWVEKNKVIATNYKRGAMIPINSEIKITGYSPKVIEFIITDSNDVKINYINVPKYTKLETSELINNIFSDTKVELNKFSKEAREAINVGEIIEGMTKEEVLATRGYPPAHATYSLDSNVWKYWQNRFVTRDILFKENKVTSKRGIGTNNN